MTILKFVNMFILQWFYIRLAKICNEKNTEEIYGWSILYWVIPLSGWKTDFEYINNKEKSLRLI
jgi:hypothetical protein